MIEVRKLLETVDIDVDNMAPMLFTLLKRYSGKEARAYVKSVTETDGLMAYKLLVANYSPSLVHNEGQVGALVAEMRRKRAKKPAEMRRLLADLATRLRRYQLVLGEPYPEKAVKGIVLNLCDPDTKRYVTPYAGRTATFQTITAKVMEYVNMADDEAGGPRPMELDELGFPIEGTNTDDGDKKAPSDEGASGGAGSGAGDKDDNWEGYWPDPWAQTDDTLDALGKGGWWGKGKGGKGKGKGKGGGKGGKGPRDGCFTCGGAHFKIDCPQNGKGKGQWGHGGGKGKGKTKGGKGPTDGCWQCGGAHYAWQCGKGGGAKGGLRGFEEMGGDVWEHWGAPMAGGTGGPPGWVWGTGHSFLGWA